MSDPIKTSAQFRRYVTKENEGDDVSREIAAAIAAVGDKATESVWIAAFRNAC